MRALPYCAALVFTACSMSNPWFGLADSSDGSTSAATTADTTPTTDDPTAPGTTQDPSAPGTTSTTTDPTAPGTTQGPGTSEPITSSSSDPVDVTGPVDTGTVDSSSSSTGGAACTLTVADGFSDTLLVDGKESKECFDPVLTIFGRLAAGSAELIFDTSDPICNGGKNLGVLQLGSAYAVTANKSDCAKLVIYRGGDGPECNIDYFFINNVASKQALATGMFSPIDPPPMLGPKALVIPVETKAVDCCTEAATDCCNLTWFGDYQLEFPMHAAVLPGEVANDVPALDGGLARVNNIQNYTTANQCPVEFTRRDFVATRVQ